MPERRPLWKTEEERRQERKRGGMPVRMLLGMDRMGLGQKVRLNSRTGAAKSIGRRAEPSAAQGQNAWRRVRRAK